MNSKNTTTFNIYDCFNDNNHELKEIKAKLEEINTKFDKLEQSISSDSKKNNAKQSNENQDTDQQNEIFCSSDELNKLLENVKKSELFSAIFLGESIENNIEKEWIVLIVKASQWDNIVQAWDKLADQCKLEKHKPEDSKINVIKICLQLINYRWSGMSAVLIEDIHKDEHYDFHKHQRINQDGDIIKELWLPGLKNAGGEIVRKPLVLT